MFARAICAKQIMHAYNHTRMHVHRRRHANAHTCPHTSITHLLLEKGCSHPFSPSHLLSSTSLLHQPILFTSKKSSESCRKVLFPPLPFLVSLTPPLLGLSLSARYRVGGEEVRVIHIYTNKHVCIYIHVYIYISI